MREQCVCELLKLSLRPAPFIQLSALGPGWADIVLAGCQRQTILDARSFSWPAAFYTHAKHRVNWEIATVLYNILLTPQTEKNLIFTARIHSPTQMINRNTCAHSKLFIYAYMPTTFQFLLTRLHDSGFILSRENSFCLLSFPVRRKFLSARCTLCLAAAGEIYVSFNSFTMHSIMIKTNRLKHDRRH